MEQLVFLEIKIMLTVFQNTSNNGEMALCVRYQVWSKMGVFYMSVSKNELILDQFSHLFKWTSVYSFLSSLVCINMAFTRRPQKSQGKVAVGRRGLISSVAQKLWFAWLLTWWNPVSPSQGVRSFPWHFISCSVGCFTCSSTEDVFKDSR